MTCAPATTSIFGRTTIIFVSEMVLCERNCVIDLSFEKVRSTITVVDRPVWSGSWVDGNESAG